MPRKTTKTDSASTENKAYSNPKVILHLGLKALTADQAKKYLGWHVMKEGEEGERLLIDSAGDKVRCLNNLTNRPLYIKWCYALVQEILRGRWRFNFENIIIGDQGSVVSGQHRLIALVLADQMYHQNPEMYPYWNEKETSPCIDVSVAVGVDESDEVVNTLDTGKPRSLSDVLFRSDYFKSMPVSERRKKSGMLNHAVKFLWHRTGVVDAFGLERTHAESIDFIDRHGTLLKCIEHIDVEDTDGSVSKYLPQGISCGLMYLMAVSASDPQSYLDMDEPAESALNLDNLETAEMFWTLLSSGEEFDELRNQLSSLSDLAEELGNPIREIQIAMVIKAWETYLSDEKITKSKISPKMKTDEDGWKIMDETPLVGGIDFGGERENTVLEDEEEAEESPESATTDEESEDEESTDSSEEDSSEASEIEFQKKMKVMVNEEEPWEGVITSVDPLKARVGKGQKNGGKVRVIDPEITEILS